MQTILFPVCDRKVYHCRTKCDDEMLVVKLLISFYTFEMHKVQDWASH